MCRQHGSIGRWPETAGEIERNTEVSVCSPRKLKQYNAHCEFKLPQPKI